MTSTIDRPARVGLITDQTGALSFMGIANVNVAKMVIDDINSRRGLLGRPVELFVEDSATDDDVAGAVAGRLVAADVDVVVGGIVGEEYCPLDHMAYERVVADIMASGADVVFNTIVPPGLTPFVAQLHDAGFVARGGKLVCTYFDENFLNLVPAEHVEGLYGC